jgi:shikimate dehydrogenase
LAAQFRLCLVGDAVAESPSAVMQNAALHACNIDGEYELRELQPAQLPGFLGELRAGVYLGCNVTKPYKAALAAACDRLEGDADVLGVVNTITVDGGRLVGDNTDVDGFELALSVEEMWPRPGASAIVFGAGGAAAAVSLALSRVPVSRLAVCARRPEAAQLLVARLRPVVGMETLPWDRSALLPELERADIVVNATTVGLAELPFSPHDLWISCTVADVRHRPRPVDLVEAARQTGHRASDGLEMLLQQGMLSFTRWTGCSPPWREVRSALMGAVSG